MPPPRIVTDANRELEKCDERHQVYLVDAKDATDKHRIDPNVIITNSADESWDSTNLPGIKASYAIRVYRGCMKGMTRKLLAPEQSLLASKHPRSSPTINSSTYDAPIGE